MPSGSFNARAYSFFDTLLWIACLNLLWIFFALAGAGILGAGPATAAAHIAIRKRVRGNEAPLARSFASHYFSNFGRANAIALPVMGVAVVLAMNWNYFSRSGDVISQLVAAGIFVVAIFLAGAACYLFPMYARYELPLARYLLTSSRFAFRHLAGTVILLFISAAAFYASSTVPGLIPFFSVGAWLFVTGWLCDRFFSANDESVATAEAAAPDDAVPVASVA